MPDIIEPRSIEDLSLSEANLLDENMMLKDELDECSSKLFSSQFKINDTVWIPVKPEHMADEEAFPAFECQVVEIFAESTIKRRGQSSQIVKYLLDIVHGFDQTTGFEGKVFSTKEEAAQAAEIIIKEELEKLNKRVELHKRSLAQVQAINKG